MIAVKDTKSVSFFKLEPFIPTGSTNDFLLFDPFIVSVFVQHVRTKAVTSHLFTPLFMFIHLPLIHFEPPPRLLKSKWLTYFIFAYYYAFVIVSLIWLAYFLSSGDYWGDFDYCNSWKYYCDTIAIVVILLQYYCNSYDNIECIESIATQASSGSMVCILTD